MHVKLYANLALFVSALAINQGKAQEQENTDTTQSTIARHDYELGILKKIKVSGYMQAQFQVADSTGIQSFAGGNFPSETDKRFQLRRGRIAVTYENNLTQLKIQIDAVEGGVTLKDAHFRVTEPWLQCFSITAGVMNTPFGYELEYSSSQRESPERGRMSQTIFPGERDLGAKFTFNPPKTSLYNFIKLEAGMYNGTGGNASDFDKYKNFACKLALNTALAHEKIKAGIGGSYYSGGFRNDRDSIFKVKPVDGVNGFLPDTNYANQLAERNYIGADAQVSIDWIAGLTTIRGEVITGKQAGTQTSTRTATALPTSNIYEREFMGAYFYFIQQIAKSKHRIVLKYDFYDPNTDVNGDEAGKTIGATVNRTTAADVMFSTIGIGYILSWDSNVRIMAYYDMVENEKTSVSGLTKDIKDDVFTLRFQYKF